MLDYRLFLAQLSSQVPTRYIQVFRVWRSSVHFETTVFSHDHHSHANIFYSFRAVRIVATRTYQLVHGGPVPCPTPSPSLRPHIQKRPTSPRVGQQSRRLFLGSLPLQPASFITYLSDQLESISSGHRQRVVRIDLNSA